MDISLFSAFAAGILSTLTPCVYPLIPVTLAIIKADQSKSRIRSLLHASYYSLGIFLSYTLLGLVAVFSGGFFGDLWTSMIFRTLMAVFLIMLSFYTAEIIKFRSDGLISKLSSMLSVKSSYGIVTTGAISGLLAAPCTGPLLAAILAFAATSSDKTRGILLLVFYAFGFSLPFLALSFFPGLFKLMPKSGYWLNAVKFIIASCLLCLGLNYLVIQNLSQTLLPEFFQSKFALYLCISIIISCLYLVIYFSAKNKTGKNQTLLNLVLLSISGLMMLICMNSYRQELKIVDSITLNNLNLQKLDQRPKILFFTADWCVKCHELKQIMSSEPNIIEQIKAFEMIEIDLSDISEEEKLLQKKLAIRGLPNMLFSCPDLTELDVGRIEEVLSTEELQARFRNALLASKVCS